MSDALTLAFHGAARTVTGSKHLLTLGRRRVLLDAGLFQGLKKLRLLNWEDPAFSPESIDHVLLSHTHIDHVGYLPRLVQRGLDAPVHSTPAAFELTELMLLDSAKIQEEDAAFAAKKGFSKHQPPLPLYTTEDAQAALKLRLKHDYDEWFPVLPDRLWARFHNSGHLLGAAFIELRLKAAPPGGVERDWHLVFSGDIGRFGLPLHPDPQPLPACDLLILESTYGDRRHDPKSLLDQIARPFAQTLMRRGTILIPAFAVGRSQQITLILRRLMLAGHIPKVPIHIDSPMALDATEIYGHYLNAENVDPDVFADGRLELFPTDVHFHRSVSESKQLNDLPGPRIIISASGMLTAGRVLHHLERLAPDLRNLLLLVGYQAEGTRGRSLLEGARELKIHGSYVPVRCEVLPVQGLSGHADSEELLQWVGSAPTPPRHVFLVHGELPASQALAEKLEARFGARTHIPELGQKFDLWPLLDAN